VRERWLKSKWKIRRQFSRSDVAATESAEGGQSGFVTQEQSPTMAWFTEWWGLRHPLPFLPSKTVR